MGTREPNDDIESNVIHPRRGDNVVHPVGQRHTETSSRPSDQRQHHSWQQHATSDFRPFKRWFPWMVPSFVVANIVIFFVTMYVNDCPKNSVSCIATFLGRLSFQPFKENPLLGPSATTLEKMGALEVSKMVHKHQAWRLITCLWLHAGVFHVLANMLSLIFIGIRLEQEFGFVRIGLVYMISGLGGSILSALFIQAGISVGASGALFGLLGGMLSELITNWTIYANKLATLLTLLFIIILNLGVGILPHVDNFAHIGGFLSGFFLGFVLLIRPQYGWVSRKSRPPGYIAPPAKSKHKTYQYILWTISLVLLISCFTLGLVMLLRGVNLNDRCPWCHYLSCIPTSKWSCKSQPVFCESGAVGNQLNLTCIGNGKSDMYSLTDNSSSSRIEQLCSQLCS